MSPHRPLAAVALALSLTACAAFPDLPRDPGSQAALAAPYPDLLPIDALLERRNAVTITPDTNADLLARAAALRARADRLRRRQPNS